VRLKKHNVPEIFMVILVAYENLVLVVLNIAAILNLFFGNKIFNFFFEFVLQENAKSFAF
jgi:hypothetical protein